MILKTKNTAQKRFILSRSSRASLVRPTSLFCYTKSLQPTTSALSTLVSYFHTRIVCVKTSYACVTVEKWNDESGSVVDQKRPFYRAVCSTADQKLMEPALNLWPTGWPDPDTECLCIELRDYFDDSACATSECFLLKVSGLCSTHIQITRISNTIVNLLSIEK